MSTDLAAAITVLVTQFFLLLYVLLMVEFRQPEQRWRWYWIIIAGLLVMGHVLWIASGHYAQYKQVGTFTLLIPYMLATLWCSRYRDARTLFGVSNASYIGCICGINGYIAQMLFPSLTFLPLVVRVVSLVGMFFVIRRFARTCHTMYKQLKRGWLLLWMIPLVTSLISFAISAWFLFDVPLLSAIAVYGLLIVCGVSYYLMYLFFEQVQTRNEMETSQKMLSLQVTGLQSRIQAVNATEERVRIERHDLKHRLELVREMVQRGETAAALAFVDKAQQQLAESKTVRWCAPPVLDAVFSSYFEQAKAQHIRVEARLAFSDPLPVDEAELAIVFANALENAIHACMTLPEEQRELHCTVIAQPSLMLEVSNPCQEAVFFDAEGLPLSKKEGHGFGTRSIAAFCQKHGAVYHFTQENGMFTMQVIL